MKKKKTISVHVGEKEVSLPDSLLKPILEEISNQLGSDFAGSDFEVTIEVVYEEIREEIPLSDFNKKLKRALDFNPKAGN